ncbi:MAG: phosphate ABC transporter permease PstA [Chloroflexi bacterium]|nr:phosphate ABC transporter permease PstA [Chloroflexota bacterium]MQC28037.1 phosphate ABC transporter permease PstA [Chloroflexota bacterium]
MSALASTSQVRRKRRLESLVLGLTGLATLVIALPVVIVMIYVVSNGAGAISWEFIFHGPERAGREGGFWPVIVLTMYALILAAIFAVPIGVACAIYLAEYARAGLLLRIINLTIVNLAGVPSIVYGLFGAALFLDVLDQDKTLWVASATLAIQALAIIITSVREALIAVPAGLREGSLALGVSKLRTTAFITLPQASGGIITGVLLAISRAAGETAPILVVGAILSTNVTLNPVDAAGGRAQMLSFELYGRITEGLGFEEERKWGIALILLSIVLAFNVSALLLRARIQRASRR